MSAGAGQSHVTSIVVERDWRAVFDFMASTENLEKWSFGTRDIAISENGLVEGCSLFDGARTFLRIAAEPETGAIDYHLGGQRDRLVPRIAVRIVPGETLGLPEGQCVLTMIGWRSADMDDMRWRRLTASHEFEIVLLKSLLERDPS